MLLNLLRVPFALCVLLIGMQSLRAQDENAGLQYASFKDGVALAAKTGRPLLVFGIRDGWLHCEAAEKAVQTDETVQLLMTQYVSMKIPAGSPEFWSLFEKLAKDDPSITDKIGLPALFVFTPKGAVVFVGPKSRTGIKVDDDFKKILVDGITQTGYLSRGGDDVTADFKDSEKSVRTLLRSDKLVEAATQLSALYSKPPSENSRELNAQQIADLEEMTQLVAPAASLGKSLDRASKQAMSKAKRLIAAAIKEAASDEAQTLDVAVDAAVQIQTLQQAFAGFPEADSFFSEAWTRLEEKSGKSDLAALAKDRIENPPAQPAGADVQRQWKSKNGKFTVMAVMIAVEDDSVRLKTDDKEIDVPLSVLSDADQKFVKQAGK